MHESPVICPLLKIIPKPSNIIPTPPDSDDSKTKSSGFTLGESFSVLHSFINNAISNYFDFSSPGYVVLVSIVVVAFVSFFIVLRNPERREIIRNLIMFRSRTTNVQYSRVSHRVGWFTNDVKFGGVCILICIGVN